ncbi:hypothetical protein D9758_012018 [Tetrapyrgos nigripes]|uniref:Protein kinase domain-containing protein n=1 Tax=Tetrapyrgos nigripes TaxID=182062 RepID=A0A8H5CR42_9AGAR|nr:hypothetical protein D9758_012018 [Tetrapyrgos nigripes]
MADSDSDDGIPWVVGSEPEENGYQLLFEGIASTISKTLASVDGTEPQWIVVKSATTVKKFSKEPHDIVKEARILTELTELGGHVNIIPIIETTPDLNRRTMNIWMPLIPYSLDQLLDTTAFVPELGSARFYLLTRSIFIQLLSALSFLHSWGIAHRDIKPTNILLTNEGQVQLVDFGIVWDGIKELNVERGKKLEEDGKDGTQKWPSDLWPEERGKMYFQAHTVPQNSFSE